MKYNVFLDTNVFDKARFHFSCGQIGKLRKYVEMGLVKLFTNEIVVRETSRHIKRDIKKATSELNKTIKEKTVLLELWEDEFCPLKDKLPVEKFVSKVEENFAAFLKEMNAIIMTNEMVSASELFEDYFAPKAPFEEGEKKKSEFPDATMIKSLKHYIGKNNIQSMLIVSEDKGWRDAFLGDTTVCFFDDLGKLLSYISIQEEIAKAYLAYIEKAQSKIKEKVEEYIGDYEWISLLEDQFYNHIEIEDLNDQRIEVEKLIFKGFEYVGEEDATARYDFVVNAYFEYDYDNYDNAFWDKEDGGWYNLDRIRRKERYRLIIRVAIELLRADGEIDFENIIVDETFELGEDQLIEQTEVNLTEERERDDYFSEYGTCPRCGKTITLENDGGDGFCSECKFKE